MRAEQPLRFLKFHWILIIETKFEASIHLEIFIVKQTERVCTAKIKSIALKAGGMKKTPDNIGFSLIKNEER